MNKVIVQNQKASFWKRLLATIIDIFVCFCWIMVWTIAYFDSWAGHFRVSNYLYYPWLCTIILTILIIWVIIPILTKGRTLGLFMCNLKIITQKPGKNLSKAICQRQLLFAFLWIVAILIYLIFISPETFIQLTMISKSNYSWSLTSTQKAFLMPPSVVAGAAALIDGFMILTNAKTKRVGWNDSLSSTFTVYESKTEQIVLDDWSNIKIKPKQRVLPIINFKN